MIYLSKLVAVRFADLRQQLNVSPSQLIDRLIDRYIAMESNIQQGEDDLNLAASLSDLLPIDGEQNEDVVPSTSQLRSTLKFAFVLVQRYQIVQLVSKVHCRCRGQLFIKSELDFKGTTKYEIQCNQCANVIDWSAVAIERTDFPAASVALGCQLAGISHAKWLAFSTLLGLPSISNDLWYTCIEKQINPLVFRQYVDESFTLIHECQQRNEPLVIIADMTWDSSRDGRYGVEAFMDYQTKKVVHFEVVPSRDAGRSVQCEVIGFNLGLNHLKQYLNIKEIIYDAHNSIPKQLRERHPDIQDLSTDCWHWVEKTEKKAVKCFDPKKKESYWPQLKDKPLFIKKHAWYCLKQCDGDPERFLNLLSNFVNHVQNDHVMCYHYNQNAYCASGNWSRFEEFDELDESPIPFSIVQDTSAIKILHEFMKKGIFGTKSSPIEMARRLVRERHSSQLESYFHACLVHTPKYCFFKNIVNFSALRAIATLNWNAGKDNEPKDLGLHRFERQIIKHFTSGVFDDSVLSKEFTDFSMAIIYKQHEIGRERQMREEEKKAAELKKKENQINKIIDGVTKEKTTKRKREDEEQIPNNPDVIPENQKTPQKKRRVTTSAEQNILSSYLNNPNRLEPNILQEIIQKLGSEWDTTRIKNWYRNNNNKAKTKVNK